MRAFAILAAALALAIAGCSSDDPGNGDGTSSSPATGPPTPGGGMVDHTARTYTVPMQGNAFVNGTLTVYVGDTVTWVHADGTTAHTVTADDASFDSSPNCGVGGVGVPLSEVCMVDGDEFTLKLAKSGTVAYHCKLHAAMKGTLTVQEHPAA